MDGIHNLPRTLKNKRKKAKKKKWPKGRKI